MGKIDFHARKLPRHHRAHGRRPITPALKFPHSHAIFPQFPRDFTKDALHPDLWAKDVGPSTELRKYFAHEESRFGEFAVRYRMELDENAAARTFAGDLRRHLEDDDVLLLYAAKNPKCNHAIILRDWLIERLPHRLS